MKEKGECTRMTAVSLIVFSFCIGLSALTVPLVMCDDLVLSRHFITREEARILVSETLRTVKQAKKDLDIGIETKDMEGLREYVMYPRLNLERRWSEYDIDTDDDSRQLAYCIGLVGALNGLEGALKRPDGIAARKYKQLAKKDFETSLADCENVARKLGVK